MKITIERMQLEHLEKIKEILTSDFDEFWNENVLTNELENPASTYLVAIDETKEIVGYAGIWKPIDEAHITNLVVRKDKRNQRIGTRLLEELIHLAREEKLKSITLEVNVSNLQAIHLYQKYQFKQLGIRKRYYHNQDDAMIMTLYFNDIKEKYE